MIEWGLAKCCSKPKDNLYSPNSSSFFLDGEQINVCQKCGKIQKVKVLRFDWNTIWDSSKGGRFRQYQKLFKRKENLQIEFIETDRKCSVCNKTIDLSQWIYSIIDDKLICSKCKEDTI